MEQSYADQSYISDLTITAAPQLSESIPPVVHSKLQAPRNPEPECQAMMQEDQVDELVNIEAIFFRLPPQY